MTLLLVLIFLAILFPKLLRFLLLALVVFLLWTCPFFKG